MLLGQRCQSFEKLPPKNVKVLHKQCPLLVSGGSRISLVGGPEPVRGRGPLMQMLFGKNYVKMKELGPVGGRAPGMLPRSDNAGHSSSL